MRNILLDGLIIFSSNIQKNFTYDGDVINKPFANEVDGLKLGKHLNENETSKQILIGPHDNYLDTNEQ